MKKKILISGVALLALMLLVGSAGASEGFTTLKEVPADTLTTSELAEVEAKGSFPKGYCTWYVDQKVRSDWKLKNGTTWQGDAKNWYKNAKSAGFKVGDKPKVGAIVVYNEKFYADYGHVAYVTKADGRNFTVSEMNVKGWNVTSTRSDTTKNNNTIAGFIYKK